MWFPLKVFTSVEVTPEQVYLLEGGKSSHMAAGVGLHFHACLCHDSACVTILAASFRASPLMCLRFEKRPTLGAAQTCTGISSLDPNSDIVVGCWTLAVSRWIKLHLLTYLSGNSLCAAYGVELFLSSFLKMLHISVGNSVTSQDWTTSSKQVIFVLKCLMTNLHILSGCHFSFPSDLVHINNNRGDDNTCLGALHTSCWCTMGELLTHS